MKKFISLSAYLFIVYSSTIFSQGTAFISELAPVHRTYYDIQSNGSPHLIQFDTLYPGTNVHAVFQCSLESDSLNSSRRVIFCFSTDNGDTWTDYGPQPPEYRSGFPVLQIMRDGSALIGMNTNYGSGLDRAQWFADIAPGAGTFVRLDPGASGLGPLWPNGITTASLNNTTKFVFAAGNMLNRGLSVVNSSFSGYVAQPDISNSFSCAFARGQNGKIGMAYIMDATVTPGKVSYRESTDDGVTWGASVLVWNPAVNNNYGAYLGIDMTYNGNSPCIVFETVKYISNQPDIHSTARIQFWSPTVNSGNPVVLDSSNDMTGANPQQDGFAAVCRPVIGRVRDTCFFVAYCKARTDILDSNNYFDIYFRHSTNSGSFWYSASRITNNSGPIRDNRYVSISGRNIYGYSMIFHMLFQQDSIPGSFVNGAEKSLARIMYCKLVLPTGGFGIQNIGSENPEAFRLKQNFPNPFNPKTIIDFDIPKESEVELTVYNSQGKVIAVLVDQNLTAGSYRVDWDAEKFSSGIYFSTIRAGNFYESKKMVLIK
ncbi:MAG TPA: T9SS type A sorting domain-containing protein [Ignavibacteria bacterium]|nr:T9SS type A sorting domain-containing protein [Ignavibacteria bacterium]